MKARLPPERRKDVENRLDKVETRLTGVETRLTAVEGRLEKFEHRVSASFQVVDQRLTRLESDMVEIKTTLRTLVARIPATRPKRRR